jgi:hypothetical protein
MLQILLWGAANVVLTCIYMCCFFPWICCGDWGSIYFLLPWQCFCMFLTYGWKNAATVLQWHKVIVAWVRVILQGTRFHILVIPDGRGEAGIKTLDPLRRSALANWKTCMHVPVAYVRTIEHKCTRPVPTLLDYPIPLHARATSSSADEIEWMLACCTLTILASLQFCIACVFDSQKLPNLSPAASRPRNKRLPELTHISTRAHHSWIDDGVDELILTTSCEHGLYIPYRRWGGSEVHLIYSY